MTPIGVINCSCIISRQLSSPLGNIWPLILHSDVVELGDTDSWEGHQESWRERPLLLSPFWSLNMYVLPIGNTVLLIAVNTKYILYIKSWISRVLSLNWNISCIKEVVLTLNQVRSLQVICFVIWLEDTWIIYLLLDIPCQKMGPLV